jgi:hypothetical protein
MRTLDATSLAALSYTLGSEATNVLPLDEKPGF